MDLVVIVQSHMDLYTLQPYVRQLRARGANLIFALAGAVQEDSRELVREGEEVVDLDEIAAGHRRAGMAHNLFRLAFAPRDFSYLYRKWARKTFGSKFRSLARALSLPLPTWKANRVNRNLGRLMRPFLDNPFPAERILQVTKSYVPHLLCASGQRIYTIVGSWDHPGKYPMGHPSEMVFVWNRSLADDWREYQDESDIRISYPVLHDYALGALDLPAGELADRSTGRIMYPASTCSWSQEDIHGEELRLMEALCRATAGSGRTLMLKPKPNARPGELDRFSDAWDHVETGHYQSDGTSSTFRLSEDYNRRRLQELDRCDLVVNLGTTFAVDAAAYGLPVLQLRMERPGDYPVLSKLADYPHLARHYYNREELLCRLGPQGTLEQQLAFLGGEAKDEMDKARAFALYLREWIYPETDLETAAGKVAEACLS